MMMIRMMVVATSTKTKMIMRMMIITMMMMTMAVINTIPIITIISIDHHPQVFLLDHTARAALSDLILF